MPDTTNEIVSNPYKERKKIFRKSQATSQELIVLVRLSV